MTPTEPAAAGSDETSPYIAFDSGPSPAPDAVEYAGRTWRHAGQLRVDRPGTWRTLWRRTPDFLPRYRPEERIVFRGGPCDGFACETHPAIRSVHVPHLTGRGVASLEFRRTGETDHAGRTVFRLHEPARAAV